MSLIMVVCSAVPGLGVELSSRKSSVRVEVGHECGIAILWLTRVGERVDVTWGDGMLVKSVPVLPFGVCSSGFLEALEGSSIIFLGCTILFSS